MVQEHSYVRSVWSLRARYAFVGVVVAGLCVSGCSKPRKRHLERAVWDPNARPPSTASTASTSPESSTPTANTPAVYTPASVAPTPSPNATIAALPAPAGQVGSQYWYQGNTYGNPYKVHSQVEATVAAEVVALVNQERAKVGVPPVALDPQAEVAAKIHSEDQADRGYLDHFTPEGWGPGQRMQMIGADGYSALAENTAQGQDTAAEVMQVWMSSTGHRENILSTSYTHLGVGVAASKRVWTQVFTRRP